MIFGTLTNPKSGNTRSIRFNIEHNRVKYQTGQFGMASETTHHAAVASFEVISIAIKP